MPTHRPAASTTGATRWRPSCSSPKARSGSVPAGSVSSSVDITWPSWVKRSTPVQSASVTTPTGLPSSSTTMMAPCARLGSRLSACPVVAVGPSVSGVSCTRSRDLTQEITSATTSTGMSCGRTAMPPRRATVSAIRAAGDGGHIGHDHRDRGAAAVLSWSGPRRAGSRRPTGSARGRRRCRSGRGLAR